MKKEDTEKRLQEKVMAYKMLENRLETLGKQQSMFANRMMEINNTIASVEEIKKGEQDILFPLGSAAFAKGKVSEEKRIIVEIGAGVVLEKTIEDGIALLEERKKELENANTVLNNEIETIARQMQVIEADTQQIISNAQQDEEKFRVITNE